MPKFATHANPPLIRQPLKAETPARTYEGGAGAQYDDRSALYLLAAVSMVGETNFYESADGRDERLRQLVRAVTAADPAWVQAFVPHLRSALLMRSAAIVVAAEYVAAGGPHGRQVVRAALQRADEPAEMLAYWMGRYGRSIPQPIKRGVADACRHLYTQRNALRYDGNARAMRFTDVIALTHPRPIGTDQAATFRWLMDERYDRLDPEVSTAGTDELAAHRALQSVPMEARRRHVSPETIRQLGSWEALSGWLADGGGMDAAAWEAAIPQMGYMALLRNLRNFDQAGISPIATGVVTARLANPDEVARSRQHPIAFLKAFRSVETFNYHSALETALDLSLASVPRLKGRTAIMVDLSGSMIQPSMFTDRGWTKRNPSTAPWEHAAVFGGALAKRAEDAILIGYSSTHAAKPYSIIEANAPVLTLVERLATCEAFGGGTQTQQIAGALALAARTSGRPFDRLVVLTDEQAFASSSMAAEAVAAIPRIITFNIAGYARAWGQTNARRITVGGLSDVGFALIERLERVGGGWADVWSAEASTNRRETA